MLIAINAKWTIRPVFFVIIFFFIRMYKSSYLCHIQLIKWNQMCRLCVFKEWFFIGFFPSLAIMYSKDCGQATVRTSFGIQVKGVDIEVLLFYLFYISLSTEKVILLYTLVQEFQIQFFWIINIKSINYNTFDV